MFYNLFEALILDPPSFHPSPSPLRLFLGIKAEVILNDKGF